MSLLIAGIIFTKGKFVCYLNPPSIRKQTNVVKQWGQFDPKQRCFIFLGIVRFIRLRFMQDSRELADW